MKVRDEMSNYKNGTSRGLSPRGEDGTADDKISRLLKELKSGPKSRRELEATLHVGRNVLTKRFLGPAEKKGLVAKTKHGSSPSQKYQLATAAMEKQDAEQVASVSEAGSPNPALGEFKLSEKQAEPQGNGISASEAHCPLASTPVNLVR